jgi:surfeit locus 1 family protein
VFGITLKNRQVRSAAVATLIALAILIALGVWQLHRLHWKENILAQIDLAEASPPVPLGANPAPFTKVIATGMLLPGTALYGAQVHDFPNGQSQMGAQRLQIMLRGGQVPVLVDLGWVPEGAKPPFPSTRPTPARSRPRTIPRPGISTRWTPPRSQRRWAFIKWRPTR